MSIKIMIADFLYNNDRGPTINLVPLNIGYVASYVKKIYGSEFEIKLYRNVDKFIRDFNYAPPNIVALSQYIWNNDLAKNILKWIKNCQQNIVTVSGGPMVGVTEKSINAFFEMNPLVDFCVPGYGEYGFSEILQRYLDSERDVELMKHEAIRGVSFISKTGLVHSFADQLTVKPDEIPSPYMTGLLDEFLEDGYSPVLQTMRGCPYSCTYCFASKLKISKFSVQRVINELDYIYGRTTSSALTVTDDNFGLYKRDIRIAKKIKSIYDERGHPNKLYLYYAKKPTKTVVEISKIIGNLTPFFLSFQSRNQKTLDAIKRYNISDEDVNTIKRMCKNNGIRVASEMIFGLPNETKESFIRGVEEVFKLDVDSVAIYNCKFFNGTDLCSKQSKEDYRIKTMHRFYEDNFQVFKTNTDYGDIIACETDEISVSSSSYSFRDFLFVRIMGFWFELCLARQVYYETLKHLENYDISPIKFINELINIIDNMPSRLKFFFNEVVTKYKEELYVTHYDLKEGYKKLIEKDPNYKSIKINLYYIYFLIFTDLRNCLDDFIKQFCKKLAKDNLTNKEYKNFVEPLNELFNYQSNSVIKLTIFDDLLNQSNSSERFNIQDAKVLSSGPDYSQPSHYQEDRTSKIEVKSCEYNFYWSKSRYRVIDDYTYDFVSWKNDGYSKKINTYKVCDRVSIEFTPINPNQFVAFVRSVDKDIRPLTWHNYLHSSILKARTQIISSKESGTKRRTIKGSSGFNVGAEG